MPEKLFSRKGETAVARFLANIDLGCDTRDFWVYRVVLRYFMINALIPHDVPLILIDILLKILLRGLCPPALRLQIRLGAVGAVASPD